MFYILQYQISTQDSSYFWTISLPYLLCVHDSVGVGWEVGENAQYTCWKLEDSLQGKVPPSTMCITCTGSDCQAWNFHLLSYLTSPILYVNIKKHVYPNMQT